MPNIPTGGSELPRAVLEVAAPRLEPVVRAPPLVTENKQGQALKNDPESERRKDERRQKKQKVLIDQRAGADRREHEVDDDGAKDDTNRDQSSLGRHINIRV